MLSKTKEPRSSTGSDHFYETVGLKLRFPLSHSPDQLPTGAQRCSYTRPPALTWRKPGDKDHLWFWLAVTMAPHRLAPVAKHVIGVEIIEEARGSCPGKTRPETAFQLWILAGDVLKVLDTIEEKSRISLSWPAPRRHPSQSAGQDHRLRCRPVGIHQLQTHQPGSADRNAGYQIGGLLRGHVQQQCMLRRCVAVKKKDIQNKGWKVAYFRAFCRVSIIREVLRKARFSCGKHIYFSSWLEKIGWPEKVGV